MFLNLKIKYKVPTHEAEICLQSHTSLIWSFFFLQLVEKLTDPLYALEIRAQILENQTSQNFTYYGAEYGNVEDQGTVHISVLAPNGDAVSVTSTVNT